MIGNKSYEQKYFELIDFIGNESEFVIKICESQAENGEEFNRGLLSFCRKLTGKILEIELHK